MAKTVVGLFDNMSEAQRAVQDLIDNGIDRDQISLIANDARGEYKNYGGSGTKAEKGAGSGAVTGGVLGGITGLLVGIGALAIPGIGPVLAAGPLAAALGTAGASTLVGAGLGAATGGVIGGLVGLGIPEEDAQMYAEGVRRGGTLVTVQTSDNMAHQAADILQNAGAIDLDARGNEWRQSGWSGFDANAQPYTTEEINRFRTTRPTSTASTTSATTTRGTNLNQGEAVLPVVEEELQVGKRQVQRGGVRVHTTVEERPVEEQVNLREERVNVERRPVNRPVSDADRTAFKEQSFEVTETAEEAVVNKQARVIEEVVVSKDVRDRTETVRDTVRRQDVHVDNQGDERSVGATAFETYDSDFRNRFQSNLSNSGFTYDQYTPVYRYGYSLANNARYNNQDWSAIEPEARRYWEERNPNTWDQFKDEVRYAWDRARGTR